MFDKLDFSTAGNMHSMTVGNRGPVMLEDYHLTEKLAQFHRCTLGPYALRIALSLHALRAPTSGLQAQSIGQPG